MKRIHWVVGIRKKTKKCDSRLTTTILHRRPAYEITSEKEKPLLKIIRGSSFNSEQIKRINLLFASHYVVSSSYWHRR